jgi:hypothetical protein
VRGLPLASSTELVAGWGTGPALDLAYNPRRTRAEALKLGTEGTLIPSYRQRHPTPLQVALRPVDGAKDLSGGIDSLEIEGHTLPLAVEGGGCAT